jgi:hypothetical protein
MLVTELPVDEIGHLTEACRLLLLGYESGRGRCWRMRSSEMVEVWSYWNQEGVLLRMAHISKRRGVFSKSQYSVEGGTK